MDISFVQDESGGSTRVLSCATGGRPALLLVHGAGVSADMWVRNVDALGRSVDVYAVDLPGHGFSDPIELGTGTPQRTLATHLHRVREALGLKAVTVIGSSFGALLACHMHLIDPRHVSRLVLVASASTFAGEDEYRASLTRAKKSAATAMDQPSTEKTERRLAAIQYDSGTVPLEVLIPLTTSYACASVRDFYVKLTESLLSPGALRDQRISERFNEINIPVLVVGSTNDPSVAIDSTLLAAEGLSLGTVVTFAECGHQPHVERPDQFNQAVTDFLATS